MAHTLLIGIMMRSMLLRFLFCVLVLSASPAYSALNAYEPFDYTPVGSDLLGDNGGFGFSAPWNTGGFNAFINTNYDVASGSLSFGSLLTQGNSVSTGPVSQIAGLTRDLAVPLGVPGTTAYVSFLLQPQGTLGEGVFNGFFGLTLESPDEPEVFMGKPGGDALDKYVIEYRGGANQHPSSVTPEVGQTTLIVVRADFGLPGFDDTFTMFANPVPGGAEPLVGDVLSANVSTITGLTLYSSGAYAIDELRVGDTFADVTPTVSTVPEGGPGLPLLTFAVAFVFVLRYYFDVKSGLLRH
ncbi:MAG: hypothetical protein ABI680_01800 [Chthoniobacteraceae bacterium]